MLAIRSWLEWIASADPSQKLVCPRDQYPNDAINLVCAEPACQQHLVHWPDWFHNKLNRQLFVNLLRAGAFFVALGLGIFHFQWPIFAYTFLLTLLLLTIMLREYPRAQKRTLYGGAVVYIVVGAAHLCSRFPVTLGQLYFVVLPVPLVLMYLGATLVYRARGRMGYYPFFTGMLGLLLALVCLQYLALWQGMSSWGGWLSAALRLAASSMIGGVIIGGVLAGIQKNLPSLRETNIDTPRVRAWNPRRVVFHRRGYTGPRALQVLAQQVDRLVYLVVLHLRTGLMKLVNTIVRYVNSTMEAVFGLLSTLVTLCRRSVRRLGHVMMETLLVVVDGVRASLTIGRSYLPLLAFPFALLAVAAHSSASLAKLVSAYVGHGDMQLVPGMFLWSAVLLATVAGLVASQTKVPLARVGQSLQEGLVDAAIGALVVFLLTSYGLAFSGSLIQPNPYRIGPITIAATLLLVVALGYSLLFMRGHTEDAEESGEQVALDGDAPVSAGATIQVAPVITASGILIVALAAIG